MSPLPHPDPIREIAASRAREAARIANLGTFQGERKTQAKAAMPFRLKPLDGLLLAAIIVLSIYAGLYAWAAALPGAV